MKAKRKSQTPLSVNPLVSIIMPTYNRAPLLGESISSVVNQTYKNWELIILDDGSEDNSRELIETFRDRRIRYRHFHHTGLLGKLRNSGIRNSSGELIAFQDSDDVWLPEKLDIQIRKLLDDQGAAFILTDNYQIGENAVQVPAYNTTFTGDIFTPLLIDNWIHFCGTSLVFKRDVLDTIGLLEESGKMMREFHFFLRMSAVYNGIFLNEKLVKVRRHNTNTSNQYKARALASMQVIIQDLSKRKMITYPEYKKLASLYHYKTGLSHRLERNRRESRASFAKSIAVNPFFVKAYLRLMQSWLGR